MQYKDDKAQKILYILKLGLGIKICRHLERGNIKDRNKALLGKCPMILLGTRCPMECSI